MSEFSLNKEVLAALENCKNAQEITALAKTRGITLSDEQANRIFSATHGEALTDEEMDMVVGGDLDGKGNDGAGTKGCDNDYSHCHERYCAGHCD